MKLPTTLAAVGAATAATLALSVAPANAQVVEGDPQARFYGTCTDNYVAFWVVSDGDPSTTAPDVQMRVDVKYKPVLSEVMSPGDYDEVHRRFEANGVPKVVQVFADGRLLAERTFSCGFYAQFKHRVR